MTPEEMLEQRHELKLTWVDPWPACGPDGNELTATVEENNPREPVGEPRPTSKDLPQ